MDKGKQRGGQRKGAGRKKTSVNQYTFRADRMTAEIIEQQPNKTDFIRMCVQRMAADSQREDMLKIEGADVIPMNNVKPFFLPFVSVKVVAGFPIPLDTDEKTQDIDILRLLCPHPEASYLIRVVGDSMIDANIMPGDILIVDKSNRNPSENEIAVCELNGEYTVKRFMKKGEYGCLVPANPNYPVIEIKEGDNFNVWGTVAYIIHKPKL